MVMAHLWKVIVHEIQQPQLNKILHLLQIFNHGWCPNEHA